MIEFVKESNETTIADRFSVLQGVSSFAEFQQQMQNYREEGMELPRWDCVRGRNNIESASGS